MVCVSITFLVYVTTCTETYTKKCCTIKPPDIATLTTPSPAKKQCLKYSEEAAKHLSTNTRKMAPSKAIVKTLTPKKLQFSLSSGETESMGNVEQLFSGMTVDKPCTLQRIKGVLTYSYISGWWEDFDYSMDQMHGYAFFSTVASRKRTLNSIGKTSTHLLWSLNGQSLWQKGVDDNHSR